jgi:precorrin-4 methylase
MTVYFIGAGPGATEYCQEKCMALFRFGNATTQKTGEPK